MNDLRNWKNINQRLVDRGKEITIFINQKDMDWTEELQKLNNGKRGAPYEYPNTLIFAGIAIKCLQHKGYRQLQGFVEDLSKFLNFDVPDFRTFWWRTNELEKQQIRFNPPIRKKIAVAIDSTGIKLVNDGEYRTKKYKKKKDWAKFHTSVNEETGEALTIVITKDNINDTEEFKKLLEPITDITEKVDADKAYDSEKNFKYCDCHDIKAGIPVKINSTTENRKSKFRRKAVSEQFGIEIKRGKRKVRLTKEAKEAKQKEWKKKIKQGDRWFVEGFYSRYKRQFGEYVFSRKKELIEKEIIMKTNILNKFITMR
jgi:IS5 family transposase